MRPNTQFQVRRVGIGIQITGIFALLMLVLCPAGLFAGPVDAEQAQNVVKGWLKTNYQPLGASLGRQIERVETFTNDDAEAVYYVVYLQPGGYVIVPADDAVEPILCFVETGAYDPSDDRPLGALVGRDVPARIAAVRGLEAAKAGVLLQSTTGQDETALEEAIGNARAKRDRLAAASTGVTIMGLPGVADMRVGPLVQSTWGQATVGGYVGGTSCYNYYTPPYEAGNSDNYPIGCVAAAMAQLMRYHQYPGTYAWSNMPLAPDGGITPVERQAIGWLCYQVAESIDTVYGSGSSTASLDDGYLSLRNSFGYGNTVIATSPAMGATLNNMVNTNLDAGLPVLLGIKGTSGHAVVCDGYGYNSSTLYHHLNMGWSGHDNAWYALPVVDASYYYNTIHSCVYNIFISGSGEIISGRATDMAGNAIPDVQIAATPSGYSTLYTSTNAQGIYVFTKLPSNRFVTLTAGKPPHLFANKAATTGRSSDYGSTGNVWRVDFVSTSHTPPTAYSGAASAISGTAQNIVLSAGDDGHPNPPGRISYKIAVLPMHGTLSDPVGGKITTVPYTLANYGNTVNYWPCTYYTGPDELYFAANDGGTPPEGGDGEPAVVAIDVNNVTITTFAPQTDLVTPWPFGTSYEDSRTQVIYLSSDIGGPKTITALALDVWERPGYQLNYWTIRMKHTSRNAYYSAPYFETSGWTTVYFNHEPRPTTGWCQFDFQTPFEYNGTSNLMIDFSHDNRSWAYDGTCAASETGADRVLMQFSDSMHGSPTSWRDSTFDYYFYFADAVPNIRLTSEVTAEPIIGDFVANCSVDVTDLAALCDAWLSSLGDPEWYPACDISEPADNIINELDFAEFAEQWGQSAEQKQ